MSQAADLSPTAPPRPGIVGALNDELEQWIVCPGCVTVDVGWAGVCRCGREMVRVYSEKAIDRAEAVVAETREG